MGHGWRCAVIPAPPGLVARFKHSDTNGKPHYSQMQVIAFDDDGYPMVLHDKCHDLRRANSYTNFADVGEDSHPPIVAMIGAGGWRIEYTDVDDGSKWSEPLVGWGLAANGFVYPLETDTDGVVMQIGTPPSQEGRIYHPDTQHLIQASDGPGGGSEDGDDDRDQS